MLKYPIVAVTGLNATDNPGPGVAVITALRADPEFKGSIVGLAYDALDPGLYVEGLLDAAFLIPYPSAGRQALFDRLAWIKSRVGLDVLIPTLDSELPALLDQEPRLHALGIHTFMPTRAQYDMRSKARLDALRDHGIPVPRGVVLSSVDKLYTLHEDLGSPLVVKGCFYGANVCYTPSEAVKSFHKQAAKWGLPIIVQEHVDGEEVNVCAVGDGKGGLLGAVPMKKLMLTDSGKGWAGVTIDDPALLALTEDFMRATKWRGPCELEVRKARSGAMNLIEVNPRFPAWCDLTAGAGQNLIAAVVDRALGGDGTVDPYVVGTAFVRVSQNLIVPIESLGAISTVGEMVEEVSA